jgi:hypothetical protein
MRELTLMPHLASLVQATCGSGSTIQDNPDGAVQIKVPGRDCCRRQAVDPFIR